jgi:predicted DNA-binding protein (UPF0278 family)
MAQRDKAHKFVELANKRVNKAIKDLKLIGNLANKKNYEYNEEQGKKIVRVLQKEVETIRKGFLNAENDSQDEFRL